MRDPNLENAVTKVLIEASAKWATAMENEDGGTANLNCTLHFEAMARAIIEQFGINKALVK